jgi:hypothetical protein
MTKEEKMDYYREMWKGFDISIYELIETILDDFESRICGNCKYSEDIEKSYERCEELGINIGRDFGCNLFEPKDK